MTDSTLRWYKGEHKTLCMTHYQGQYGYLNTHRKHQCAVEDKHIDTVGDLVMQTLANLGIQQIFGVAKYSHGGLTDAIRVQQEKGNINFYDVHHEGAAAFAVSAYGKLTGRPAACLSNAGSSASKLLKELSNATVDRVPVIALTGQVGTQTNNSGALQKIDQQSVVGNNTAQWSKTVQHDSCHAELAILAYKKAIVNRGVSHLIFPDEIPKLPLEGFVQNNSQKIRLPSQKIAPPQDALEDAIEMLRASERPVIFVGQGARGGMKAVIQLAEQLRAPVITTIKGKGLIPDNHPLAGGVFGRSGTPVASWLINESDALLVFATSFNNDNDITPKRPTVQVDHDLKSLARLHSVEVPVWGDISVTAQALSDEFLGDMWTQDQTSDIAARWSIWRDEQQRCKLDHHNKTINSRALFDLLSDVVEKDTIIAVDAGNETDSFSRYFKCKQQSILMSRHDHSTGFAFPTAMGAWSATQEDDPRFKDRQVVAISDDGGFGQYLTEIKTAVKHDMNITHILMNRGERIKISKQLRVDRCDAWQTSLLNSSFAEYAQLCGAMGIRVTETSELGRALEQALNYPGPALIEVILVPN